MPPSSLHTSIFLGHMTVYTSNEQLCIQHYYISYMCISMRESSLTELCQFIHVQNPGSEYRCRDDQLKNYGNKKFLSNTILEKSFITPPYKFSKGLCMIMIVSLIVLLGELRVSTSFHRCIPTYSFS